VQGGGGGGGQRDALKKMCQTIANQAQVEQQFVCHICNAKLANKPSLVTHIKGSHLAESLFQCDLCDKSFNWYMQLYRHKKRYHPSTVQNFGYRQVFNGGQQQGAYEQSCQSDYDAK